MKLSFKLQWFKTISRREILAKHAYSIMIIFLHVFNIKISCVRSIQGRMSRFCRIMAAKKKKKKN